MKVQEAGSDLLVDRAVRLFEFLTRVQRLSERPVRLVDTYVSQGGTVLWLHDLPEHSAVASSAVGADPEPGDPILTIDRVPRTDPPALPEVLVPWISGAIDDPTREPSLKDRAVVLDDSHDEHGTGDQPTTVIHLEDHPDIEDQILVWLEDWQAWADTERTARPVRKLYGELFSAQVAYDNAREDWEAVLGVGAVSWRPDGHDPVVRHCLTFPVTFDFDDDTGRLTVRPSEGGNLAVELDMLDLRLWPEQPRVAELKDAAEEYEAHPLHHDEVGSIARRLTHHLSSDGSYTDANQPGEPARELNCTYAPAVILRKRTRRGLIEVFQTIKAQIEQRGQVPEGLRVLLDPELAPNITEVADPTTGAWIEDGEDAYLPLPVNDRQREIIHRVDKSAMTLVQGPPGTGKTHTAAALISHLLAQGKRVLVTAQTDQALKEVREKLPESIRDLSVSVVGADRQDMADLKIAVRKLSQAASDFSTSDAAEQTQQALSNIDDLKQRKAHLVRQLLELREVETLCVSHADYSGTLEEIAKQHVSEAEHLGWLANITEIAPDTDVPLANAEAIELLKLLRDDSLEQDESEASRDLPDLSLLTEPAVYAEQLSEEARASDRSAGQAHTRDHEAYRAVASLSTEVRRELRQRIDELAGRAHDLTRRSEQWLEQALEDVRAGRLQTWQVQQENLRTLVPKASAPVQHLGPLVDVTVTSVDARSLLPHAEAIRGYLSAGKTLKLDPSTRKPRQGLMTPKVVKDAESLFENVAVNGVPPTTVSDLDTFTTWVTANVAVGALDRSWPANVTVPKDGSLSARLAWHEAELHVLDQVLALGHDLIEEEGRLAELGVPKPDWTDLAGVQRFAALVDAAAAAEEYVEARSPLEALELLTSDAALWSDAAPVNHQLNLAVRQRDSHLYREAYQRLQRLMDVREQVKRRNELVDRLVAGGSTLARQLMESRSADHWDARFETFEAAWSWAATATWLRKRRESDLNELQAAYNDVEKQIRNQVAELAAVRAWSKAVDRLGLTQRSDLMQYAQLVQKYGKTGGKFANQRQREMRDAMQRCRPSVPVWIMPLYRISQALSIDANLFDVVIVDEASQAGLEATFLQYLAPKIVVIGDDKQNSPRAVGVDQQQLRDLANQLLYDDRYKASWQEPTRSLFDEARMRFEDLITLVEHRRCVPDIIGFSNQIAYEPEGIRLLPVRQVGRNALVPIRPVFVSDGYVRGERNKVNPAEVDAIVEQVEKCLADEAYDGLTFGVISLTGPHQAQAIEKKLMDRIDPREWQARNLRCGTAPDFQGSERDVMFLSMVVVREEGRRYAPLTSDTYLQQFNVSASRAQDQMWVFHSIRPEELTNHEDMRYQLLDYCYRVARRRERAGEGHSTSPVPEDRRVAPFDSLFEQRVHNRIFDRGHTVIPQYPVGPKRIDLVVVGANGKLAVECDGDPWHPPEKYLEDLSRQRELERSGWDFFRVRGSEFTVDPAAALEPLWALLDELEEPAPLHDAVTPAVDTAPVDAAGNITDVHIDASPPDPPVPTTPPQDQGREGRGEPAGPYDTDVRVPSTPTADVPRVAPTHRSQQQESAEAAEPEHLGADPLEDLAAVYASPTAYQQWDTATVLVDVTEASRSQVQDGLRQIVAVEGPILGQRLYRLYVHSSGGSRVGTAINRTLDKAISQMVRNGTLIADDPLGIGDPEAKTYRLLDQPTLVVRDLGDRTLHEVPPLELSARIRALRQPSDRGDTTFKRVLDAYGLTRLSARARETLERAESLSGDDSG